MSRLISRLRQLHTSDGTIAAHVRETLVESLYASPQSLVIGALTSSAITMTVAAISGNGLMLGVALTIAAVAAIRIIDVMRPPPPRLGLPSGRVIRNSSTAPARSAIPRCSACSAC